MYQVSITRNGENVSEFECDAVCLSYLKDGNILSSASAEPQVNVCDMSMLGCAAASSALRVVDMCSAADNQEKASVTFGNNPTTDEINLVYKQN